MKRKKVAKLMAVVALVGAVGAGGSLALLTAQSGTVTNTFVVGKGLVDADLTLDEAAMQNTTTEGSKNAVSRVENVGKDGYEYAPIKGEGAGRVTQNEYTGLQPGDDIFKDPTVHMAAQSAESYLFINVKGVDNLASKGVSIDDFNNMLGDIWKKVPNQTPAGNVDGIYYLASGEEYQIVKTSEEVQNFPVFESLNATDDMFDSNGDSLITTADSITVKACAVQATNVTPEGAIEELPPAFLGGITIGNNN